MHIRDLRDFSGPWKGFWIQELIRGNMRLNLRFAGSDIDGGGTDPVGPFEVSGIFSEITGGVLFTVTYASHAVEYSGSWDGSLIYGKWTLHDDQFTEIGDFEIWPDRDEQLATIGAATADDSLKIPDL